MIVGMGAARLYVSAFPSERPVIRAMVLFSLLSLLPDADVIAFALKIPYQAPFGHRGASHSLAFALMMSAPAVLFARMFSLPIIRTAAFVSAVVASHGLLDAFTDGGLGAALLWPLSDKRFFFFWRPIPVAPIGERMFSGWGLRVLLTELIAFAPLLIYAIWPRPEGRRARAE